MNWKDSNATINSALKDLSDLADMAQPAEDGSTDPKYAAIEQRVVYQMRNGMQNHPARFVEVYGDHPVGRRVVAAETAKTILMEKDPDAALAELNEMNPSLYAAVTDALETMMAAYPAPGGGEGQGGGAIAPPGGEPFVGGGAGIDPNSLKTKKDMTTDGRPDLLKMWIEGVIKPIASPIKDVLDSMAEFYLIQPGKALGEELSEFAKPTHDYPAIP